MTKFHKFILTFFLLVVLFNPATVFAHPLDITACEFRVTSGESQIQASAFIHPFLIGLLLKEQSIEYDSPLDFYNHKKIIIDYLNQKTNFKNNNEPCQIVSANMPPLDEFELMGGGLIIEFVLDCQKEISRFDYTNKLFIEFSKLQTNKMIFFKDGQIQSYYIGDKEQHERILTSKIFTGYYNFSSNQENREIFTDSDGDGLSDAQEDIYETNINLVDSDFDTYSDKEEIDNGWDPLDWNISPGQNEIISPIEAEKKYNLYYQEKLNTEDEINSKATNEEEIADNSTDDSNQIIISSENKQGQATDSSQYFNTGMLQKFLDKLKDLFNQDGVWSKFLIFIFVYALGALHALESGHGKSILFAHLTEHDKNKKDALLFSSTMTLTHLADVIILAVIFKALALSGNAYQYINDLQKIGVYALLIIGIYYLVKSLAPKDNFEKKSSPKKAGWLGFLAGLAPCTIGWAIMIILLSIGKTAWIFPVVIVFGLGIWTTMLLLGFVILKIKNKFFSKIKNIAKYSSIASSILLIIIALVLIIKLY